MQRTTVSPAWVDVPDPAVRRAQVLRSEAQLHALTLHTPGGSQS